MLQARVRNGRLELSEPTDLPEGQVVELMPVAEAYADDFDERDLDPEELAALNASLEEGLAEARAGKLIPAEVVLAGLRARAQQ